MGILSKIFKKDKAGDGDASASASPSATSPSPATGTTSSQAPAASSTSANLEKPQGVILHTNLGDITIALFSEQTPKTCKNFATLAATKKYDGVIFHRIIAGFMIQGGDPTGSGMGGSSIYGGKFEDEIVASLKHTDKGTLSMANSGPGTNGSQFFITLGPTPHLDGKHTVFGHVADGMDVVDKLGAVATDKGDKPREKVYIKSAEAF